MFPRDESIKLIYVVKHSFFRVGVIFKFYICNIKFKTIDIMANKYFIATFFNRVDGDFCPICTERVFIDDLRKYRRRIWEYGLFFRYFMRLKFDFVVFTFLDDCRYARWFDYEEFTKDGRKKRPIPYGAPASYYLCSVNLQYLRSTVCLDDYVL